MVEFQQVIAKTEGRLSVTFVEVICIMLDLNNGLLTLLTDMIIVYCTFRVSLSE